MRVFAFSVLTKRVATTTVTKYIELKQAHAIDLGQRSRVYIVFRTKVAAHHIHAPDVNHLIPVIFKSHLNPSVHKMKASNIYIPSLELRWSA